MEAPENKGTSATQPPDAGPRRAGKILGDGVLAALAWGLAFALLRHAAPGSRDVALFSALALAVNAVFGLTGQHYRLVGLAEAWSLLQGSMVLATVSMAFCAIGGHALLGVAGAEVF